MIGFLKIEIDKQEIRRELIEYLSTYLAANYELGTHDHIKEMERHYEKLEDIVINERKHYYSKVFGSVIKYLDENYIPKLDKSNQN